MLYTKLNLNLNTKALYRILAYTSKLLNLAKAPLILILLNTI